MTTTAVEWQHGDYPTATKLNTISTALTEAHAALGDYGYNMAVAKASSAVFHALHTHRYLKFSSNGELVDINGTFDPVTLSEGDSGTGTLDLDTVGWLGYGMLYKVTGVSAVIEDWAP